MNFQQPPPSNQSLQIPSTLKNVGENIGNTFEKAKTGFNTSVSGFSDQAQAGSNASQAFLQSNTIIAKFAFLMLIIIGFFFLLALGVSLIQYFLSPPTNPYLIQGMVDGNISKTIPGDPKLSNSVSINRSNNESKGLEFTWSVWLRIDNLDESSITDSKYQHIFNKGDTNFNAIGIASINNGPGVYLASPLTVEHAASNTATLHIIMNTSNENDVNNTIDISNCPLKKWFHLTIRMQNTIMDVYVNGIISNRLIMQQIPKQNYNDVNIGQNAGFAGKISNLRYYASALNVFEINSIVYSGPDMTPSSLDTSTNSKNYTYLSNNWYASKM